MGLTTGCWSLGLIFGPAVGGLLANPVQLYPETFGKSVLFKNYPYLLPNMITSFFALLGGCLVSYYFPETLFLKDHRKQNNNIELNTTNASDTTETQKTTETIQENNKKNTVFELLQIPGVTWNF